MLVSTQIKIPIMELCDTNKDLVSLESHKQINSNHSTDKSNILCKHCKRSSTNGIRCLGMCVADNDY